MMTNLTPQDAPRVTKMQVIPVAGRDHMLLNLSGAHGPFFTRNVVVLEDDTGRRGVGEVPGGEKIRQTLEDAKALVEGQPIGHYNEILNQVRAAYADRDSGGRGNQTLTCAPPFTQSPRLRAPCSTCSDNF